MTRPLLLCTDLDRTLLPNGAEPESPLARPLFRRLAASEQLTLTYVTGRDAKRVEAALAEWGLPKADHRVTDVGSTILDAEGRRWAAWDEHIAPGWDGQDGPTLARVVGEWPGLSLQDPSRQGRFKLSYEVDPAASTDHLASGIAERLRNRGLDVAVVASQDDVAHVGLIDVLPAAAGKAAAIEFLRKHLGRTRGETVFAGDSGNDLDVLTGPLPAVLVANARPEVRAAARAGAAALGYGDRLYLAGGGALGMNGNYAAGIVEGVLHYHPDRARDLRGEGT